MHHREVVPVAFHGTKESNEEKMQKFTMTAYL